MSNDELHRRIVEDFGNFERWAKRRESLWLRFQEQVGYPLVVALLAAIVTFLWQSSQNADLALASVERQERTIERVERVVTDHVSMRPAHGEEAIETDLDAVREKLRRVADEQERRTSRVYKDDRK